MNPKSVFSILCIALSLIVFLNCTRSNADETQWEVFGESITPGGFSLVSDVIDRFEPENEKIFKLTGTLHEVCQQKGCWTTLAADDGRMIRMTFKNYGYFLPVDYAGREIIAEGMGLIKVTSVDELRHYAEDVNKPKEEIMAITQPKTEYLFEARGVLVKKVTDV